MIDAIGGPAPFVARPRRMWPGALAGIAVGGAAVLTALGWVGSQLPAFAAGLPTVPGLLFGSPILFPVALAAAGVVAAGPAVRSRGRWAACASVVGGMAILLAEAAVAVSSANLLVMYQQGMYRLVMPG
jgi:hypothetical protein